MENHTPETFYWCEFLFCPWSHETACFLCAFVCKLDCSSNSWKLPAASATRRIVGSIGLVSGSASCKAVGIHLKWQFSWHSSRIRRTSKVVLYSSHDGIAVRVTKSNKDLQSVTIIARWSSFKAFGGWRQSKSLITNEPHNKRIQLSLSTPRDTEKASADKVDLTTLAIFLDDQVNGLIGAVTFSWSSGVVANTMVPWKDDSCLGLAKEASPNTTWVTLSTGIDRKWIWVSLVSWASLKSLFASSSVFTVGRAIWTWISPSFEAKSGLVWVTAYCTLPINPRRADFSLSLALCSGKLLRCLPISIGRIPWMQSCCEAVIPKSGVCSREMPVKVNFRCLKAPKGKRVWSSWIFWWKIESPPHTPSSTWVPKTPCKILFHLPGFQGNVCKALMDEAWIQDVEAVASVLYRKVREHLLGHKHSQSMNKLGYPRVEVFVLILLGVP